MLYDAIRITTVDLVSHLTGSKMFDANCVNNKLENNKSGIQNGYSAFHERP